MTHKFKKIDEDRYWYMLGALPPAEHHYHGFLVGEPYSFRRCEVTGKVTETFTACFRGAPDDHFEAIEPMTKAEFRATDLDDILANLAA